MKGIYCLLINVSRKINIEIGKKKKTKVELPKGNYIYVGSALGPGEKALENRIARHLSNSDKKRVHWHIDYILNSENTKIEQIYYKESKNREDECKTSKLIENVGGSPMQGLGSSDCKCKGHLFFVGNLSRKIIKELKNQKFIESFYY